MQQSKALCSARPPFLASILRRAGPVPAASPDWAARGECNLFVAGCMKAAAAPLLAASCTTPLITSRAAPRNVGPRPWPSLHSSSARCSLRYT